MEKTITKKVLLNEVIKKLVISEIDNDLNGCEESHLLNEEEKVFDIESTCEVIELRVSHPIAIPKNVPKTAAKLLFDGAADEIWLEVYIDGTLYKKYNPEVWINSWTAKGFQFIEFNRTLPNYDKEFYDIYADEIKHKIDDPSTLHLIICTNSYR